VNELGGELRGGGTCGVEKACNGAKGEEGEGGSLGAL
jgi:hypothetical protein